MSRHATFLLLSGKCPAALYAVWALASYELPRSAEAAALRASAAVMWC